LRRQENVSIPGTHRKEPRKEAFNEKIGNAPDVLDKTHSSAAALCRFRSVALAASDVLIVIA
jgi:hypothetical protein